MVWPIAAWPPVYPEFVPSDDRLRTWSKGGPPLRPARVWRVYIRILQYRCQINKDRPSLTHSAGATRQVAPAPPGCGRSRLPGGIKQLTPAVYRDFQSTVGGGSSESSRIRPLSRGTPWEGMRAGPRLASRRGAPAVREKPVSRKSCSYPAGATSRPPLTGTSSSGDPAPAPVRASKGLPKDEPLPPRRPEPPLDVELDRQPLSGTRFADGLRS